MKITLSILQVIAILLGIFICVVSILLFTGSVVTLGHNISQDNFLLDYAIGIAYAIVLGTSIFLWPIPNQDKQALILVWLVKVLVVLSFMLFYENSYDFLDAYSYFSVPQQADFSWHGFVLGDGTENLYSLIWLYYKLFPYSYHALKIVFAMLGLVAIYIIYRAVVIFLKKEDLHILYLLAFFPSILFWSSILGKDPINLLLVAIYFYGVIAWLCRRKYRYSLAVVLSMFLLMYLRGWLVLILAVPLLIVYCMQTQNLRQKLLLLVFFGTLVLISLHWFLNQFQIGSQQDFLETLPTIAQGWSMGGSGQTIAQNLTQPLGIITFLPLGIFTALLRPLPGELLTLFGILAGLENLILLLLLLRAIKRARLRDFKDPLVLWAFLLVIIWATVYGFISYQNLGTAVRFRLQILPIFLLLLMYLGGKSRRVWGCCNLNLYGVNCAKLSRKCSFTTCKLRFSRHFCFVTPRLNSDCNSPSMSTIEHSQKKKILVITSSIRTILWFCLDLLHDFINSGFEVVVCAPQDTDTKTDIPILQAIGVRFAVIRVNNTSLNFFYDLITLLDLLRVIKKEKPATVFGYIIKPVIYGSIAARMLKVKNIYALIPGVGSLFVDNSLHMKIARFFATKLYAFSLRFNQKVFFLNPDNRNLFLQMKVVHPSQVVLVNSCGVNVDYYAAAAIPTRITFLLASRLLKDKGIFEYVAAARILKAKYPDIVFKLLGRTHQNKNSLTEKEVRKIEMDGVVDYGGFVADTRPVLLQTSVFVLPSYYGEGVPRVLLEAMSMCRPIITTDAPGCRETVVDGVNGFLVPVKNVERLVVAMEKFILHPELIPAMGEESRRIAVAKYDVNKVNQIILREIKALELTH